MIVAENQAGHEGTPSGSFFAALAPLPAAGSRMLTRVPPARGDRTLSDPPQD